MKLFKENGQLSERGQMFFDEVLKSGINKVLHSAESAAEVQLLGSLIHNYVGNAILDKALKINQK